MAAIFTYAHAPGDRARDRRPARTEGDGTRADGVPHERGALGVSRSGAESGSSCASTACRFDEALDASRTNNVFTTHTSVPAGIDLFDAGLMYEYFGDYCRGCGHRFRSVAVARAWQPVRSAGEVLDGRFWPSTRPAFRNAVSRLHRADLAGNVAATSGRSFLSGKCRSRRSPTACTCRAGSTAISPPSTTSTLRRNGANSTMIRKSGTMIRTFRMKSCWKRTSGASVAW